MSKAPTEQDIEELKIFTDPHCLTIYIPFDDSAATADGNRIVMKNILRDAEKALVKAHADTREIIAVLEPAHDLMKNMAFWPTRRESIAIYSVPDFFRSYRLPDISIPIELRVGRGFDVGPLEEALAENIQYFVLALSHKHTRLYRGDRFDLQVVELDGVPTDMKTALRIDEFPKSLQTHTVAPTSKVNESEAFHEQYDVSHTDKEMLLEFFRLINRSLQPMLLDSNIPLVIGGVEYLTSMYRKVNTYPGLLDKAIIGNLDRKNLDEIRAAAWTIVSE